ncbi:hypothetical protein ABZ702_18065 [Streptomyces cyaneofuscatus]|uniref:hypothetical protein n=1 Tax=Streptomyces cyaneofuscatus TaxID=66883 RepID=UPI0033D29460
MRRRILTAVAPLAAVLLVGGCSGSADTGSPEGAGSKTSPAASEPAASPAPPSSPGGTSAPALEYPEKAQALVPETSGAGDKNLPAFTPAEETYTIYADCTGKGSVSLVDRDNPDGKPHPISCDDVPTVGVIHTEAVPQRLMVKVTGGAAQWAIAILSGDKQPA